MSDPPEAIPDPANAVPIRFGEDPTIQEITEFGAQDESSYKQKRPRSMMTTRSTMTNEDDYSATIHTNTPQTSARATPLPQMIMHDMLDDDVISDDEDIDDDITTMKSSDKMSGLQLENWKHGHHVHFPTARTATFRQISSRRNMDEFPPEDFLHEEFEQDDLQFEPPFIHRPDRTLIVHQSYPSPMHPVQAWPGYGGNVYFNPFRIDPKPIGDRSFSTTKSSTGSRRSAHSRMSSIRSSEPQYALSEYYELPFDLGRSQSRILSSKPPTLATSKVRTKTASSLDRHVEKQSEKIPYRKLSYLDKKFVNGMKNNSRVSEDKVWIQGLESLGSLKIGNRTSHHHQHQRDTPHDEIKRPRTGSAFVDTISQKSMQSRPSTRQSTSKANNIERSKLEKFCAATDIPRWALEEFISRKKQLHPNSSLRVKGSSFRHPPRHLKRNNMSMSMAVHLSRRPFGLVKS